MSKGKEKGQLVRLTVRDYQLLREALVMADEWRGSRNAADLPEFNEMSDERWATLRKIRECVYPRKASRADAPLIAGDALGGPSP